jgi:hypothetical protein
MLEWMTTSNDDPKQRFDCGYGRFTLLFLTLPMYFSLLLFLQRVLLCSQGVPLMMMFRLLLFFVTLMKMIRLREHSLD